MGSMKTFFIFGFERWGNLKPSKMWLGKGKCYCPLFLGIWIRCKKEDLWYEGII
jgi:hypothetical protein